jgi:hypothetical protein
MKIEVWQKLLLQILPLQILPLQILLFIRKEVRKKEALNIGLKGNKKEYSIILNRHKTDIYTSAG